MWDVVDALRSIPELSDEDMRGVRVAIADRFIAQPCLGDMQSWDLMLFGDGFVPLTCDLFSFHGDFLFSGLHEIVLNLLGPAGLDSSSQGLHPYGSDFQYVSGCGPGVCKGIDVETGFRSAGRRVPICGYCGDARGDGWMGV